MTDTTPAVRIDREKLIQRLLKRAPVIADPNDRKLLYACIDALDAVPAAATAAAAPVVPAGEGPMTNAEVEQWIDACNHEPARQVLRDYLALRARSSPDLSGDMDEAFAYIEETLRLLIATKSPKGALGSRVASSGWRLKAIKEHLAALSPSREGVEPEAGADTRSEWAKEQDASMLAHPAPSDPSATERANVMAAEDAPVWAEGIVTNGERVAFAQKAEADYGGTYWATDEGDGALEWEPTHFIARAALGEA